MRGVSSKNNKVLLLALKAGEILLKSGAEVYRVEDTVTRLCRACGVPFAECFVTTTGIFLSVGHDGEGQELGTALKRVSHIGIDLEKISRVNAFVREFTDTKLSVDEGIRRLDAIEAIEPFSLLVRIVAIAFIGCFYTIMNGGGLADALCGLVVGVLTFVLSLGVERLRINRFISIFISCFACAGLSLLAFNLGFGNSLSSIIVGAITVFLPGVAITNAARDLLSGDMLSGVSRMAESLLVAVAIAGGVGIFLHMAPSPLRPDVLSSFGLAPEFLFALFGTMGISVSVNIPRRRLILAAFIAACGWVVREALQNGGYSPIVACFVGACAIAVIAEVATRLTKETATLFIIPAIFPLVPGRGMYDTMAHLITNDYASAARMGLETLFIAGGIALGLLVVISLSRIAAVAYRSVFKRTG
jgi:uncharacterized membrane protein YjjP (DUF1212 family)